MNINCEHCKKIRDMGLQRLCKPCWRILNLNKKSEKGKSR